MFNLKTTAVAAAVALAPMSASAVAILENGITNIDQTELYTGFVIPASNEENGGTWIHTFIAGPGINANARMTIDIDVLGTFSNLSMNWVAADGMTTEVVTGEITTLDTIFDAGEQQNLQFAWDGAEFGNGFDFRVRVDVAAVPVPAAGLMLLTALGGAAALRRRAK